jgi:hypothetical protein
LRELLRSSGVAAAPNSNAKLRLTMTQLGTADRLDNAPFLKEFLGGGR